MAIYLARTMTDATLEEIGFVFKKGHASVEYALQQVKKSRRLIGFCGFLKEKICQEI